MAIKSSGQLSLRYDIAAEISNATNDISLRKEADIAGFASPDSMSEFYGFSLLANDFYTDGKAGWLGNNRGAKEPIDITLGCTMSGWFDINSAAKRNTWLFSCGSTNRNPPRGAVTCQYNASLNRIIVAVWDRFGQRRIRREYPLHDANNRNITGVSNSTTGWYRSQKGNKHPDGLDMCNIAVTWDGSNNYTSLKLFWNGDELPASVNNTSTSTQINILVGFIAFRNAHYLGDNKSVFQGLADSFAFFTTAIESNELGNIIDNGNKMITDSDTAFLRYSQGFEGDTTTQVYDPNSFAPTLQGSIIGYGAYP
jgi:hypothetical protein